MTAITQAIAKIDEKIEIYQFAKLEASSMERHHGAKIALVFIRQELVNLLEMEKQQAVDFAYDIADDLACGVLSKKAIEDRYNEFFKSE